MVLGPRGFVMLSGTLVILSEGSMQSAVRWKCTPTAYEGKTTLAVAAASELP